MKFRTTIEAPNRGYDVEFEIDDEAAARARLAQVLTEIQKRFSATTERATKPVTRVAPATAEASARKEVEHAK